MELLHRCTHDLHDAFLTFFSGRFGSGIIDLVFKLSFSSARTPVVLIASDIENETAVYIRILNNLKIYLVYFFKLILLLQKLHKFLSLFLARLGYTAKNRMKLSVLVQLYCFVFTHSVSLSYLYSLRPSSGKHHTSCRRPQPLRS